VVAFRAGATLAADTVVAVTAVAIIAAATVVAVTAVAIIAAAMVVAVTVVAIRAAVTVVTEAVILDLTALTLINPLVQKVGKTEVMEILLKTLNMKMVGAGEKGECLTRVTLQTRQISNPSLQALLLI
jgi:flagellar biosynthesis protein FlhB